MGDTDYALVVSLPEGNSETYPLTTEAITIGRSERNHIRISSDSVSATHCQFAEMDNALRVSDLGSKNGTEINGTPVPKGESALVQEGDFILIGKTVYIQIVDSQSVDPEQIRPLTSPEPLPESAAPLPSPAAPQFSSSPIAAAAPQPKPTPEFVDRSEEEMDRKYDEIAMNPVAAAVARATRPFTGDE